MNELSFTALDAGTTSVGADAIAALAGRMRGRLLDANASAYDEARGIWNAMIDRKPALIARCAGPADVVTALRFASDRDLLVSVRGGGHNIAGNAVCDGGLVIDLSPMKTVRVNTTARRAWVEPGATLGDVDKATQAFGLAVPTGINSTTGIAGLTLGGGFGWLTRKFGLTLDNLLSADVVTADGQLQRASSAENPELFWALRGGGGNFGVVTAFEFQLHPLGPKVLSGLVLYPLDNATEVLKSYRQILADAPDEVTCWAVLRQAPPLPFIPAEWHGKGVVILAICYCGTLEAEQKATAELCTIGTPIADVVAPHDFADWQQAFDALVTPGARNYWKTHDFEALGDPVIEILTTAVRELPGPECEIFIGHVGGAAGRVPANATAFPQRSSHYVMNVHARWRDPSQDQACISWARSIFETAKPHAVGTAYVNFMPEDDIDRVEMAYGDNYRRLTETKQRYDPRNLFRMNQNVRPAGAASATALKPKPGSGDR